MEEIDAAAAASPPRAIRALPAHTAQHLRSALVLFQPSQAIHEVMANALDAGATRVDVVVDFDRLAFSVMDNGSGMTLADLRMLGQRHVTSKCGSVDELAASASARTIGWRGEALSSIAQLCVLEIQTRARDKYSDVQQPQLKQPLSQPQQTQPQQPDAKRRKIDAVQKVIASAFDGLLPAHGAAAAAVAPVVAAASASFSLATSVAASAAASSSAVAVGPSATYSKLIRHGVEVSCGLASEPRATAGTTVGLSEMYASMPVRAKMMTEDKSRGREREKLKRKIMRLALVHPQVEFALYDATGAQSRVNNAAPAQAAAAAAAAAAHSRHFAADDRSSDSSEPASAAAAASASLTTHLPIYSSQRIWYKPKTASLLENFQMIFGSAAASPSISSPSSSSAEFSPRLYALEHHEVSSSLVALPRFAPVTPSMTTEATTAFLSGMRVSGFLSHPAHQHLYHKDMQFVFVNRHFVLHKAIQKTVDGMYERLAKIIPSANGSPMTPASSPPDEKRRQRPTGNALQRGSIKHKSGGGAPSPAKQGRRRHPAYLLHIELPAHSYDLLFDPDKTTIEFSENWAVQEGVTQALRKWLMNLYPALACLDKTIFPPTYMPLWLTRREDTEEEAQATAAAAASSSAGASTVAAPTVHSTTITISSPSRPLHILASNDSATPTEQRSPARVASRSASAFRMQSSSHPISPATTSSVRPLSSSVAPLSILQPERLHYGERPAPASSAAASAARPTFHSSFGHMTASDGRSRTPSAFLARSSGVTPLVHQPLTRTGSRSNAGANASANSHARHHARTTAAPAAAAAATTIAAPTRHRSREHAPSSAHVSVRDIARDAIVSSSTEEFGERQRWSSAVEAEMDGSMSWTGAEAGDSSDEEDGAPLAPHTIAQQIRASVPTKQRQPEETVEEDPMPAEFQDFISSSVDHHSSSSAAASYRSPIKAPLPTQDAASPREPTLATRRTVGSFTGARTPPRRSAPEIAAEEPKARQSADTLACPCAHDHDHAHVHQPTAAAAAASGVTLAPPHAPSSNYLSPPRVGASAVARVSPPSLSLSPTPSPPPFHPISSSWLPQHAPVSGGPSASTSTQFHPVQLAREVLQRCEVVGQLDNKFIVVHVDGLLLAVDQHAADERRRLEFLQGHLDQYVQQLPLVLPMPLPISASEEMVLRTHEAEMSAWGFRFRFSTTALPQQQSSSASSTHRSSALVSCRVLLLSVPLICGVELDVDDFREYLQQLRDTKPISKAAAAAAAAASLALSPSKRVSSPSPLAAFRQRTPLPVQRVLNYKACRSSVMFGDPLPLPLMRNIVAGLMRCEFPYNCAHGRPTMTPIVHVQPLQKQPAETPAANLEAAWTDDVRELFSSTC